MRFSFTKLVIAFVVCYTMCSVHQTDGWQGELADEIVKCSSQNLDGIDANDLLVDVS